MHDDGEGRGTATIEPRLAAGVMPRDNEIFIFLFAASFQLHTLMPFKVIDEKAYHLTPLVRYRQNR